MRFPRVPLVFALVPLLLACGPLGPIAGGELSGTATSPPPDWHFTDAVETVQLETRPEDPYSVNIWGVAYEDAFYVAAGGGDESAWVMHVAEDPRVRLRIGDRLFELQAQRVDDPAVRDAVMQALIRKYDFQPDPEDAATAVLFRLVPRGA